MEKPSESIPDSESLLLGCFILDEGSSLTSALNLGVTSGTFYSLKNRVIFDTLCRMLSEGRPIELSLLAQELQTTRKLEAAGGFEQLVAITKGVPTTAYVGVLLQDVLNQALVRELTREAQLLLEACKDYQGDMGERILPGISRLTTLGMGSTLSPEPTWEETIEEAVLTADTIILNAGMPADRIIPFPWDKMNDRFGPPERGQLIILAARTGSGKSSMARPIAAHAAQNRQHVYFVTLEVNPVRVALSLASSFSRVGLKALPKAPNRDRYAFKQALMSLKEAGIVCSRRDKTLNQICGRARALKRQGKLDILVLDHGGLLNDIVGARHDDVIQACGRVGKTLKHLAGELDIVVLMLWQLNRNSDREGNREPRKSDLRASGSLEEDCDKLILLHRPNENPQTGQSQDESSWVEDCPSFFINVFQAKGRDDGTSSLPMTFDRATTTFFPI